MAHVLLVDDEELLRVSLSFSLQREGYEVTAAADGITGLELARSCRPDLVLLDLMLPGLDGIEVCRRIRRWSAMPIIMLTARSEVGDRVTGLEIGADDYVTKPFNTEELLARVKAVLRRPPAERDPAGSGAAQPGRAAAASGLAVVRTGVIAAGPVRMDLDRHEVTINGAVAELAPKEFQLLRALLSHRGRVLLRSELIETVWGEDFMGDARTLDVHISWLRAKIEPDSRELRHIVTVRGFGFRFDE